MDVTLLGKGFGLIKDTELALPPYLSSQGEELSRRAPRVKGTRRQ